MLWIRRCRAESVCCLPFAVRRSWFVVLALPNLRARGKDVNFPSVRRVFFCVDYVLVVPNFLYLISPEFALFELSVCVVSGNRKCVQSKENTDTGTYKRQRYCSNLSMY